MKGWGENQRVRWGRSRRGREAGGAFWPRTHALRSRFGSKMLIQRSRHRLSAGDGRRRRADAGREEWVRQGASVQAAEECGQETHLYGRRLSRDSNQCLRSPQCVTRRTRAAMRRPGAQRKQGVGVSFRAQGGRYAGGRRTEAVQRIVKNDAATAAVDVGWIGGIRFAPVQRKLKGYATQQATWDCRCFKLGHCRKSVPVTLADK